MPNTTNNSGPRSGGLENEPEKKKEEDRKLGGFWWWSPAYLAAIVLGITGWYFWYLGHRGHEPKPVQAVQVTQPAPVQPVHVERQKIESAYFFRVDGKDTAGRAASFDFIVLTGDYTWALGSATEVVSKGAAIPEAETAERVLSPKIARVAGERERPDFGGPCLSGRRARGGGGACRGPFANDCRLARQGQQPQHGALEPDARPI